MTSQATPESFQLDHDAVKAPYVRKAGVHKLAGGCDIVKWDVRFVQPNIAHLEMPAIHSAEHMLATTLREISQDVIDISPMGCQTGYYVSVDAAALGDFEAFTEVLARAIEAALKLEEVPGATRTSCGWAASHSLTGAHAAMREFLAARPEWAEVFADA